MLKQHIKNSLQSVVENTLLSHSGDETLAYDVSRQCVTDSDVDGCLEIMLEHVSEQELELLINLINSPVYHRYSQAVTESMRVIDNRIIETLKLLTNKEGEA